MTAFKPRKIVAVRFDDGTERKVTHNQLRQWLDTEAMLDAVCGPSSSYSSRSWMKDQLEALQNVLREEKSTINIKNATGPRKPVDSLLLTAYRNEFERKHGGLRGWKKAACVDFKIDLKTLNERMKE